MDPSCKCSRYRRKDAAATPLSLVLYELAQVKGLDPTWEKRWHQLRHMWSKIMCVYGWLDPRNHGYINICEAISWLDVLWKIRARGCVGCYQVCATDMTAIGELMRNGGETREGVHDKAESGSKVKKWVVPTVHSPACETMLGILNYEAETSHLTVLDILIDLLRDLPYWIGVRSVVEKKTFIWSLYKLMVTDTYLLRKSCTWYYAISADDPRINPILRRNPRKRSGLAPQRSVIPMPDVRCLAFYQQPPEEEPLPEPIPKYNEVDLAEQRRHAEHVHRLRLATQKCQEEQARRKQFSPNDGRTLATGDYYLVPQADDKPGGGEIDECLRFQYPFLEVLHQDEKEQRRVPHGQTARADQNWRYVLAHLLKNNFSHQRGQ